MENKDTSNRIKDAVAALAKGGFDAGLENPQECGAQWNTGVMYWRATPRAVKLLDYAKEVMAADPAHPEEPMKRDDQKPINAALRVASEACPWSEEDKGPTPAERACGNDWRLHAVTRNGGCLGVLPVAQFSNGFTFTVARLHEQLRLRPFSFHATYAADKVLKLREEGAWIESPSRYNGMKLLWYEPKVPRELLPFPIDGGVDGAKRGTAAALPRASEQRRPPASTRAQTAELSLTYFPPFPKLQPIADKFRGQVTPWHHAALIQFQLQQLYAAMAIAHVLQRTIVLPRFACICGAGIFPSDSSDSHLSAPRFAPPSLLPATRSHRRPRRPPPPPRRTTRETTQSASTTGGSIAPSRATGCTSRTCVPRTTCCGAAGRG